MPDPPMAVVETKLLASLVVEWENALHSEGSRSVALLRTLRRQSEDVAAGVWAGSAPAAGSPIFELMVVFDTAELRAVDLERLLRDCVGEPDAVLAWRLLPTRGCGYYESKNIGARHATGENVIFVDSDVIPEPGWLNRMVLCLEDPAVLVLAGNSYIEPEGLVGKVFALTWFFPLRTKNGPVQPVTSFFANNLAVRRSVHQRHPFPALEGTSRGGCLVLADQLAAAGIPILLDPRARVSHPAPNGFRHFARRALAQGRDRVLRERHLGSRWTASWPASCLRLCRHVVGSTARVCTRFSKVGLHPLSVPAAAAVCWSYYLLYWIGEMLTLAGFESIRAIRV